MDEHKGESPTLRWGIIGCGDVTEVKSGPAFSKVPHSSLVAVMRRDAEKAKDYAKRHHVPKYYNDANELINDPEINAIYIATPPGSHEEYALAAIRAGKPVYVEKPMALNYSAALSIKKLSEEKNVKLTVAHYRNAQPFFREIKKKLSEGSIGNVEKVDLVFNRIAMKEDDLQQPQKAWRIDPAISGGGLFHDMAPHQLGLMLYYFGNVTRVSGTASGSNPLYKAHDRVNGQLVFESGIRFNGSWDFNATADADECIITGSNGRIRFPVFGMHEMIVEKNDTQEHISLEVPKHVQQPMIAQTVLYFLDKAANPCAAAEGCEVMRWMEDMVRNEDGNKK